MKKIIFISIVGCLFLACASESTEENSNSSLIVNENTTSENIENPYDEFITFSNSLEKTPENANILKDKYLDLVDDFTDTQIDSAFSTFENFIMYMEIPMADENILNKYDEKENQKIEKKYADLGFKLGSSEGYYFLYTDVNFLKTIFYEKGTESLKNYLDYQTLINKQMYSDGGIIITYIELAEIILKTESYLIKLKNSLYYKNVLEEYKWNLQVLLYGLDNTPIVTFSKPHELIPDVKNAYELIKKDKTVKTRIIIEEHEKFLEKIQYDMYSVSAEETQLELSYIEEKLGLK